MAAMLKVLWFSILSLFVVGISAIERFLSLLLLTYYRSVTYSLVEVAVVAGGRIAATLNL